jgi:hypothetical protein
MSVNFTTTLESCSDCGAKEVDRNDDSRVLFGLRCQEVDRKEKVFAGILSNRVTTLSWLCAPQRIAGVAGGQSRIPRFLYPSWKVNRKDPDALNGCEIVRPHPK